LEPTQLIDAHLNYLADAPRELRHNQEVEFFSGAAEVMAHVRLLGTRVLAPGQSGWVQLRLAEPVPLVKGDRFIIRRPSPPATIGGGVVVDPHPGRKHRRFRPEVLSRLETLAHGTPAEVALQTLEREGPLTGRELAQASGLGQEAWPALNELIAAKQVVVLAPQPAGHLANQVLISRSGWTALLERMERELRAYHRRYPLRPGIPREALRQQLRLAPRTFNNFLARAAAEGHVVEEGTTVRHPEHRIRFTEEQEARIQRLLRRFQAQPYTPPGVKESRALVGDEVLAALLGQGRLVQISEEILFLPETYQEMVAWVKQTIREQGSVTVAQLRDAFRTSRKYALALLEHLDATGVTRRIGDERVLR
ncbi:MAG: selenocysteine-specific translation factor, partial [Chloroflexi bacterium]